MKHILFSIILACGATAAQSQNYVFEWKGAGGYSMRGAMGLLDGTDTTRLVTEADVGCFEIYGFKDGKKVGEWVLGQRTEATTWRLQFDPAAPAFIASNDVLGMPQAWNMNGGGQNCGEGGFGFNLGSYAQDLCIDNRLIVESQIAPPTPFPVTQVEAYAFADTSCQGPLMLSAILP